MPPDVRHLFVSPVAAGTSNRLVQGPNWNETHNLQQGPAALLGRSDSTPGQAATTEVQVGPNLAFVGGNLDISASAPALGAYLPLAGGTLTGTLTINPGAAQAVNVTQAATGTVGTINSLNSIYIASDNVAAGVLNYGLKVEHHFGGTAATGTRTALTGYLVQDAVTNAANGFRGYCGIVGNAETSTGDGGTNTGSGAKGEYFGANPSSRSKGGTNINELCGIEADVMGTAASSQRYSFGVSSCSLQVNRAALLDAAYEMHCGGNAIYGPSTGWGMGLVFAELSNGIPPVATTGTLIGTYLGSLGTFTVAKGIDLSAVTFTGHAIDTPGYFVGSAGAVTATGSSAVTGAVGGFRSFIAQTAGSNRWSIGAESTAEGGANAGSNFSVIGYTDAGAFLATYLSITRSTGLATFAGSVVPSATNTYVLGSNGSRWSQINGVSGSFTGSTTVQSATAIPAGGTAGAGYMLSSTASFGVFFGSGAPTLSAAKGSLYLRSDGSTTNDRMYVNTNGSTTWTAVTTAA